MADGIDDEFEIVVDDGIRIELPPPPDFSARKTPPPVPMTAARTVECVPENAMYRSWRLTYYLIAEQVNCSGPTDVPLLAIDGSKIGMVEAEFFSMLSLQGSGRTRDGRLYNVTGRYARVQYPDYSEVKEYHEKHLSKRPFAYSGLSVQGDRVVSVLTFREVTGSGLGLGYGRIRGVDHQPFRTLAADLGLTTKSDPRFKGKGGLVPALTRVHIREFVGKKLPDGSVHDGWFTVCDTGGGIFGAHFDIFVGTKSLKRSVDIPDHGHIWFSKIESRVPDDYAYGLRDV